MDIFVYEPIDLERPAFRLLQLLRGGKGSAIECILYQAYLDGADTIPYDALSYTWGDMDKTSTVKVNGKFLEVTKNLHLALQHLRSENMDRVLWVDAICIDQSNERERGHQVQQMCKTYSQAEEVVVWLGQATEVTDVFMESLQRLDEYSSMHEHRHWDLAQWTTFWHLVPKNPRFAPQEAMNALLWRPWFERVWILQEIANAKKASILCGTKSVRARTFALAPSLVGVTPDRHSQAVLDIMPGRLRENTWWTENRDLYNLLLKFSESKASDPRDKVYALLGISSDAQNTDSLRPDYTRSLQNAIHDTSSFLFGPSDVPYETMSEFLEDLTFRSMASFVKLLKMSDASEVDRFLKCRGLEVPLSEDMIRAAAANERNGREILSLLLREREKEVIVTKGVMKAARENTTSGIVITDLLLRHCKVQIRQAVARELWVAFRYGYPGVREQLSFVKDDAKMYDAIHELVWQAPPIAFGIAVEMLLLDTGPNVDVESRMHDTILQTALAKPHETILKLLLHPSFIWIRPWSTLGRKSIII